MTVHSIMKRFRIWLEKRNEAVVRDAIVSKVRSDLGGGDDEEVLQMRTSELSEEMQRELLKLGPVMDVIDDSQVPQLMDFMRQSDSTIGTLIEKILGEQANLSPEPESLPPETNPAMAPQQTQNFPIGTGWS